MDLGAVETGSFSFFSWTATLAASLVGLGRVHAIINPALGPRQDRPAAHGDPLLYPAGTT